VRGEPRAPRTAAPAQRGEAASPGADPLRVPAAPAQKKEAPAGRGPSPGRAAPAQRGEAASPGADPLRVPAAPGCVG
ncbi:MAG TPA: 2-oxoglutarate dehydrogenase, E2 component, dihydrolipoamide succinyltransferase, partial [Chloroflexota bacterium]|nr:2-oxoglutarate dehydrogenase, E2 component, dihydrolipoamide succinyltransferase [Chloroflexota bacterium]